MLKKILSILIVGAMILSLTACSGNSASNDSVSNNSDIDDNEATSPTENIYWYITDNGTVLHLSATEPNDSNYKSWQNDWIGVAMNIGNLWCDIYLTMFAGGGMSFSDYDPLIPIYGRGRTGKNYETYLMLKNNNYDYNIFANITKAVIDNKIYPKFCSYMFNKLENLQSIENFDNLNTKYTVSFSFMFEGCKKMTEIDISNLVFDNISIIYQSMAYGDGMIALNQYMFEGCESLHKIYSNKDIIVKGITLYMPMFKGCNNLVGGNGTPFNSNKDDISMAVIDSDYQSGYFTYDSSRYYWKNGCYYINGVKQTNKWITDKFDMFYVDKSGKKLVNTWKDGRYLDNDGRMLRNTKTPDNKFVNYEGDEVDTTNDYKSINNNAVKANAWFRTENGIWYYFEGDRTTLKKGWFDDPQDGQRYYLDLDTGIMLTGWQEIDGNKYYFNERPSVIPNWYYVPENDTWASYGKKIKALGSMFRNEETPDGKKVDADGKLVK